MKPYMYYLSFMLLDLFIVVDGAKPPQSAAAEHRMLMQDRAILHVNLMNTIGLCRDPRPLIIYPPATNNKIYYPRGTVCQFAMALAYIPYPIVPYFLINIL